MLNPLKNLKGKLNHLHIPKTHFFRIILLANTLGAHPPQSTAFSQASQQFVESLKSPSINLNPRVFHKFQFDYQTHTRSAILSLPSTIFDKLSPHERKIAHVIFNYAASLNFRQLYYLNLTLRQKLNNQYAGWNHLHLSPQSPFKGQLEILPSLQGQARVNELMALRKKGVMKEALKIKEA